MGKVEPYKTPELFYSLYVKGCFTLGPWALASGNKPKFSANQGLIYEIGRHKEELKR